MAQGNYRAEVRIHTVRRLLAEIGLEPERAQLVRSSADDPLPQTERLVCEAVETICALGESPIDLKTTRPQQVGDHGRREDEPARAN